MASHAAAAPVVPAGIRTRDRRRSSSATRRTRSGRGTAPDAERSAARESGQADRNKSANRAAHRRRSDRSRRRISRSRRACGSSWRTCEEIFSLAGCATKGCRALAGSRRCSRTIDQPKTRLRGSRIRVIRMICSLSAVYRRHTPAINRITAVLARVGAGQLAGDAAAAEDEDAGRQVEDLRHLARDQDDRRCRRRRARR